MQLSFLGTQEIADLLDQGRLLLEFEGPGIGRTLVITYGGQDIIAVTNGVTGEAVIVSPNDVANDSSIHDQARLL